MKDIVDEECGESLRAEELLEKLKAYQREIPEKAVPKKTVQMYFTIYYPDHNQMQGKDRREKGVGL